MALYPIDRLGDMAPQGSPIAAAELVLLPSDAVISEHFCDQESWYFIVGGEVIFTERGVALRAGAGEVFHAGAGVLHGVQSVPESARLLVLRGSLQPPFRLKQNGPEARPTVVALPPLRPLRPTSRRGISVAMDESATFSPRQFGSSISGDLMLRMNPGAIGKGQVREIRQMLLTDCRSILALLIPIHDDEEVRDFLRMPDVADLAFALRPQAAGLEADIATDRGLKRTELARSCWSARLKAEAIQLVVATPFGVFTDGQITNIFAYLAEVPPADLKLILSWHSDELVLESRMRHVLQGMLPWLWAVELRGNGKQEIGHFLDGLGFQGWVVRKH